MWVTPRARDGYKRFAQRIRAKDKRSFIEAFGLILADWCDNPENTLPNLTKPADRDKVAERSYDEP